LFPTIAARRFFRASIRTCCPVRFLYTDALRSYRTADADYAHKFIDHSLRYVEGVVHTNSIENLWSCLKRTLHGTYIAPRAFHLQAYVEEQVFRFNSRDDIDFGRFSAVLKGADGKRIMYRDLTRSHRIWRLKPGRAKNSPIYVGH
jgi:hypothetical protein